MKKLMLAALLAASAVPALAQLIVVDARGGGLKPGQRIPATQAIALKEGERATLISPDGKTITLRGTFSGPASPGGSTQRDPKAALAALINTRSARSSAIGAIRAGASAAPLPDPWLVDISRPGPRCVREGEQPVWWRPEGGAEAPFTVFPVDRSWRADFTWGAGVDRMAAPRLSRLEGVNSFVIRNGDQESVIVLNVIPKDLDDDVLLAGWMIEKACIQQADALLKRLETEVAVAQ
jgi:hypothetical protein